MLPIGGFVGGSSEDRAKNIRVDRTVNLYPDRIGDKWVLRKVPGYVGGTSISSGGCRGMLTINGRTFAVMGPDVHELFQGLLTATLPVSTLLGTVEDDGRPVAMIANGEIASQVLINTNQKAWVLNLSTNTVTPVASFPASRTVAFVDQYGIALSANTSQMARSAPGDLSSWSASDVAARSSGADRAVHIVSRGREFLVQGEETSEIYYNSGRGNFPFVPRDGVLLDIGSAAARSAVEMHGSVHWLGQSKHGGGIVYRLDGFSSTRISTPAVEQALASYGDVSDAIAYPMTWDGHAWYVLNLPQAGHTWVYDATIGEWHERLTWNELAGEYQLYHGVHHTFAFGRAHLIGSPTSPVIFALSGSVFQDATHPLRWLRRCPHITKNRGRVTYRNVQLDMETGVGTEFGLGTDPHVAMRVSKDDGHTFGPERWRRIGAMGEYTHRVLWNRFGRPRAMTFEVSGADPVPTTLLDLLVNAA